MSGATWRLLAWDAAKNAATREWRQSIVTIESEGLYLPSINIRLTSLGIVFVGHGRQSISQLPDCQPFLLDGERRVRIASIRIRHINRIYFWKMIVMVHFVYFHFVILFSAVRLSHILVSIPILIIQTSLPIMSAAANRRPAEYPPPPSPPQAKLYSQRSPRGSAEPLNQTFDGSTPSSAEPLNQTYDVASSPSRPSTAHRPHRSTMHETENELTEDERIEYEKGVLNWSAMKSWRYWIRREWLWWYIIGVFIIVIVALMAFFHHDVSSCVK